MNVLIVLTSHAELGNTGEKTGFWLEEFASPYYRLKDAGLQLTLASPKGGQPPLDPKSDQPDFHTDATRRFENDAAAQEKLANTAKLADINAQDFDGVFYAGGHGPLWDLYNDSNSIALIETFIATGKPAAAVCHASAVLLKAKDQNGQPLVQGKQVTGFSNSEEAAVELTDIVPYLLEDQLVAMGGIYQKVDDWNPLVITDGLLITGQNPASSDAVAEALFKAIS
jgi:putative intracellular protease/amidase